MAVQAFWECPTLLGVNKRASHVPLRTHTSLPSAVRWFVPGGRESAYRGGVHSLSGPHWRFRLFRNPSVVPQRFWEEQDDHGWGQVGDAAACIVHEWSTMYMLAHAVLCRKCQT
jgi:hypothetical protein